MEDFRAPPVVSDKSGGEFPREFRLSRHAGGKKQNWLRTAVLSSVLVFGGIAVQPEAAAQQGVAVLRNPDPGIVAR